MQAPQYLFFLARLKLKICKNACVNFSIFVFPFICLHVTNWEPLIGFSLNLILGRFSKVHQHISIKFKIWQWTRKLLKCVSAHISHKITKYLLEQKLFWRKFVDKSETRASYPHFSRKLYGFQDYETMNFMLSVGSNRVNTPELRYSNIS
jgi:hypothetical protein